MKIQNSFIGGCLFAIGYIAVFLLFWGFKEATISVFDLLNIQMSPVEYLAYVLNGFSKNFEFLEFHLFIIKVIGVNLLLFYVAAYITED